MTEEAFIRAIVDSPGQDTPRLVYADWLDDHAAPDRAAYLRAEAEWAAPWRTGAQPADPAELHASAAGLDPLWVARVSRPPLGVCCEPRRFVGGGPPLTPDVLDRVAARFGVEFSPPHAAFLLNFNGGRPVPTEFTVHGRVFTFEWFPDVRFGGTPQPGFVPGCQFRPESPLEAFYTPPTPPQPPKPRGLARWFTRRARARSAAEPAMPPSRRTAIPLAVGSGDRGGLLNVYPNGSYSVFHATDDGLDFAMTGDGAPNAFALLLDLPPSHG